MGATETTGTVVRLTPEQPKYPFDARFTVPPSCVSVLDETFIEEHQPVPEIKKKYFAFKNLDHPHLIRFRAVLDEVEFCNERSSVKALYEFVPGRLAQGQLPRDQLYRQLYDLQDYLHSKGLIARFDRESFGLSEGRLMAFLRFRDCSLSQQLTHPSKTHKSVVEILDQLEGAVPYQLQREILTPDITSVFRGDSITQELPLSTIPESSLGQTPISQLPSYARPGQARPELPPAEITSFGPDVQLSTSQNMMAPRVQTPSDRFSIVPISIDRPALIPVTRTVADRSIVKLQPTRQVLPRQSIRSLEPLRRCNINLTPAMRQSIQSPVRQSQRQWQNRGMLHVRSLGRLTPSTHQPPNNTQPAPSVNKQAKLIVFQNNSFSANRYSAGRSIIPITTAQDQTQRKSISHANVQSPHLKPIPKHIQPIKNSTVPTSPMQAPYTVTLPVRPLSSLMPITMQPLPRQTPLQVPTQMPLQLPQRVTIMPQTLPPPHNWVPKQPIRQTFQPVKPLNLMRLHPHPLSPNQRVQEANKVQGWSTTSIPNKIESKPFIQQQARNSQNQIAQPNKMAQQLNKQGWQIGVGESKSTQSNKQKLVQQKRQIEPRPLVQRQQKDYRLLQVERQQAGRQGEGMRPGGSETVLSQKNAGGQRGGREVDSGSLMSAGSGSSVKTLEERVAQAIRRSKEVLEKIG